MNFRVSTTHDYHYEHDYDHDYDYELHMNLRFTTKDENAGGGLCGSGARWVHGARKHGGVAAMWGGFAAPLDGGHGTPS